MKCSEEYQGSYSPTFLPSVRILRPSPSSVQERQGGAFPGEEGRKDQGLKIGCSLPPKVRLGPSLITELRAVCVLEQRREK